MSKIGSSHLSLIRTYKYPKKIRLILIRKTPKKEVRVNWVFLKYPYLNTTNSRKGSTNIKR